MNEYRLARELGNPLSRGLQLYKTTQQWHSLTPREEGEGEEEGGLFSSAAQHHRGTAVNALDIDRQQGRYMLSGGADGSVCIWDLDSDAGTGPVSTASQKSGISSILYYPSDAGLFITGSYDETVTVWDAEGCEMAFTFALDGVVRSLAMAPKAHHTLVAVGSEAQTIRLLDLNTGAAAQTLRGHAAGGTWAVSWAPNDEFLLASGGAEGAVRLWDIRMAQSCLASLDMRNEGTQRLDPRNRAHEGAVNGVTWTEDGASLVTLGHDDKLRVWDLATGQNTKTNFEPVIRNRVPHNANPILTCLRHSDPQIVFVPSVSDIIGFNFAEGNVIFKHQVTKHKVRAVVQRPYSTELYYGSSGGSINVLAPPSERDDGQGETKEEAETSALDAIYKSLVQTPITFP